MVTNLNKKIETQQMQLATLLTVIDDLRSESAKVESENAVLRKSRDNWKALYLDQLERTVNNEEQNHIII